MRQYFSAWGIAFLVALFSFPVYAQTKITVGKFEDKSTASRCASPSEKDSVDSNLQAEMIDQLMGLDRFQIREREIRPLKAKHQFVGSVRTLEVCPVANSKGQDVEIVLDVQMLNNKGQLTHMFTSSAKVSHSADGKAMGEAMRLAVRELVSRIDNAIPKIKTARLPVARGQRLASNDYKLQLIRKPARKR